MKSKITDLMERIEEKDQKYKAAIDQIKSLQIENVNLQSEKVHQQCKAKNYIVSLYVARFKAE